MADLYERLRRFNQTTTQKPQQDTDNPEESKPDTSSGKKNSS
jgi:hypothetical protein